jgi:ribosomal protein S18 acetylase RimI-like enzyme
MRIEIALTSEQAALDQCAKLMCSSDPWITLKRGFDHCRKSLEGDFREVYVARQNEEIIGLIVLQIKGSFSGYLQSICVSPKMRGAGWGKKLIQFAEERVFKVSPNLFLCVSDFNLEAIKLYEELGYQKIGVINDFVEIGFHEILMRKTIGSWNGFKNSQLPNG